MDAPMLFACDLLAEAMRSQRAELVATVGVISTLQSWAG
jgi:hypothetical protein